MAYPVNAIAVVVRLSEKDMANETRSPSVSSVSSVAGVASSQNAVKPEPSDIIIDDEVGLSGLPSHLATHGLVILYRDALSMFRCCVKQIDVSYVVELHR
mgnify:CR=1